jgi:hypothetical protein
VRVGLIADDQRLGVVVHELESDRSERLVDRATTGIARAQVGTVEVWEDEPVP